MKFLSKQNSRALKEKICLLRIDLNIEPGQERNSNRLEAAIPTIQFLLKNKVKVVILSHRGRPNLNSKFKIPAKGEARQRRQNSELTLKPFVSLLSKKIKKPVVFIKHFKFAQIKNQISHSTNQVFLLENLRFLTGEEKNDEKLARQLASLADFYPVRNSPPRRPLRGARKRAGEISNGIYVNDAFAVCHRKNASVAAITKYLSSYAGFLLEKEIKNLDKVIKSHRHSYRHSPFTIIIGGAKISDKLGVIKNFWNRADYFLLGGGPANTFFAAQGLPVGDSLVDRSILGSPTRGSTSPAKARLAPLGRQILKLIRKEVEPRKIVLPLDVKIHNRQILDIGEKTVKEYSEIIKKSRTIIWNGPMGLFEKRGFEKGTVGIWKAILQNKKAQIVVGGGETVASLTLLNPKSYILNSNVFLSTGGGAMLEFLSGKKLPGVEALKH